MTEPAFVSVVVRDTAGTLVETISEGEILLEGPLCADGFAAFQWQVAGFPNGVYTIVFSARTEAGETDVETVQRGLIEQQSIGTFTVPEPIRGAFEMQVQLSVEFVEIATVTNITLRCYNEGVPTTIGSIDEVPPDGRAVVPGDSTPCPLGPNLLDCDLTWLDPFGVSHEWNCDQAVTYAEPFPTSFEIGLVDNYAQPEEYVFHWDERAGRLEFCLASGHGRRGGAQLGWTGRAHLGDGSGLPPVTMRFEPARHRVDVGLPRRQRHGGARR